MKKRRVFGVLMASVMLAGLALTGCSAESTDGGNDTKDNGKKTIGVSLFYRRDEYYKDLDVAFRKEADAAGLNIVLQDADSDPAKQTQQIEDFIQQGVDAIAIAPADPVGLVPVMESAVDAGIPVVVYDNIVESDKISTTVGFDYMDDGKQVGDWTVDYINKNLGGKAKVAIIDFMQSPIVCGQRATGFENAVKSLPGVEVVTRQDGKATRADAMSVMENILTANPDINVVYGINLDTCAGAKAAIEAAGRDDIIVVGSGYGEEVFKALEENDKYMKCFSSSSPQTQAKDTVAAIVKLLAGESVPKETISKSEMYTAETIKDFDWKSIIAERDK